MSDETAIVEDYGGCLRQNVFWESCCFCDGDKIVGERCCEWIRMVMMMGALLILDL